MVLPLWRPLPLAVWLPASVSVCLCDASSHHVCFCIRLSVWHFLSLCFFVCLTLPLTLSVCLSDASSHSVCFFACLLLYLPFTLSVCWSVGLSLWRFLSLTLSICLFDAFSRSICMSVCLYGALPLRPFSIFLCLLFIFLSPYFTHSLCVHLLTLLLSICISISLFLSRSLFLYFILDLIACISI